MIGPLAHGESFLTVVQFASAPTAPGVRLKAADGSTSVSRSTSGIVDMGSNQRAKLVTPPSTDGFYLPQWDDNGGALIADEAVWVSSHWADILAAGGGGGGGTSLPLIGDANGDLLGKTFLIKRNDTIPTLRRQLIDESTGDPVDLTDADTVYFTMRRMGTNVSPDTGAAPPKVHALASIITSGGLTAADGTVEYAWTEADTNQTSDGGQKYAGEFEVTFLDGSIETFPQADYITITIPVDLDPGIDP